MSTIDLVDKLNCMEDKLAVISGALNDEAMALPGTLDGTQFLLAEVREELKTISESLHENK